MLDIKSHNTNAGKGSNRDFSGAREFHPNQVAVQMKIAKKNPIVPTCFVIHRASWSSGDNFCLVIIFAFVIGLRRAISSFNVFGSWAFMGVFLFSSLQAILF